MTKYYWCQLCGCRYWQEWESLACCTEMEDARCSKCNKVVPSFRDLDNNNLCIPCRVSFLCMGCGKECEEATDKQNLCPDCIGCTICGALLEYEDGHVKTGKERCGDCSDQITRKILRYKKRALVCWAGRRVDTLSVDVMRIILTYL